jgi:hypothetical protein
MIIETIFSTLDEKGNPNFAPMGIEMGMESVSIRPFRTSKTWSNLVANPYGVANLTDNVLAFVECALFDERLPGFAARKIPGVVFQDACSWLELEIMSRAGDRERAELICQILHRDRQRDFWGFCRAKNTVIEAAILATRLTIHGRKEVLEFINKHMRIVEKTGSDIDKEAFNMIKGYVENGRRND